MKHTITLTLKNGKLRKCETEEWTRANMAWEAAERLVEAEDCIHAAWTRDGVVCCELEA